MEQTDPRFRSKNMAAMREAQEKDPMMPPMGGKTASTVQDEGWIAKKLMTINEKIEALHDSLMTVASNVGFQPAAESNDKDSADRGRVFILSGLAIERLDEIQRLASCIEDALR